MFKNWENVTFVYGVLAISWSFFIGKKDMPTAHQAFVITTIIL